MALVRPILNAMAAFDSTKQAVFTFISNGGDKVTGSKLTIKLNDTGETIYSSEQDSTSKQHVLPANTLKNNKYYTASIQSKNSSGTLSSASSSIQFWCYTTPTIQFTNIPSGNVIKGYSFTFDATYNQIEGELLSSYDIFLYNEDDNIIKSVTGDDRIYIYDVLPPPTHISYTFEGLEDGKTYKIEIVGITSCKTEVRSEKLIFNVEYGMTQFTTGIKLTNLCQRGTVLINAELKDLIGESTNGDIVYIVDGDIISADLRNNSALWKEQLSFNENFTMYITGRDFTDNDVICNLGDRNRLYYRKYLDINGKSKCYIELTNTFDSNEYFAYRIFSNEIDAPISTEFLVIYLLFADGLMDLRIENIGGVSI